MKKAELKRQEKLSQKLIKHVEHRDRVEQAQHRAVDQYEIRSNYYEDRLTHKHSLAAMRITLEKEAIIKKAKEMGSEAAMKVQQRKSNLIQEQDEHKAKWAKFTEERFQERLDQAEAIKKAVVEKNMNRNYAILKNMNRQKFAGVLEHQAKKQSLEAKLAKAEAARQQQLKEKVEKAKILTVASRFVAAEVTQKEEKPTQVKFEESKTEQIDSEKKVAETQTLEAKPNTSLVKPAGFNDGKKRKSPVFKANAVGWTISRKSKLEKKAAKADP